MSCIDKEELRKIAQNIFNRLGTGFDEPIYHRAFEIALRIRNISYDSDRSLPVFYEGFFVGIGRADIIIKGEEELVVELKATSGVGEADIVQVKTYLKALGLKKGFLLNFPQPTKVKGAEEEVELKEIMNPQIENPSI